MSVLEPQPAQGGFLKVVSTKVQRSPLKPQFPEREETLGGKQCLNVGWWLTGLKITVGHIKLSAKELASAAPRR